MDETQTPSARWKETVLHALPEPEWLRIEGPDSDVVLSTRVRLARNVEGFRFPGTMDLDEREAVAELAERAIRRLGSRFETRSRLDDSERAVLIGCRLLSADFAHDRPGGRVALDREGAVSVMVNEEDHLRVQCLRAGLAVEEAQSGATGVLAVLEETLRFSRHDRWGWLASSPMNSGEGRRRSALVHLPALTHIDLLPAAVQALEASRVVVRGAFGEASRSVGAFHQVSMISGS
ncbi:MAG: hypothetical protein MH204_02555, partial [Fimbriimonadaceae bacterium]|nr:hypothetical protein [Fimbriimonadaceae bacterium]